MNEEITIVILTYNSSEVIDHCLSGFKDGEFKIIIVDNKSSDRTLELVRSNYSFAKIIEIDKNIGYGRANNIALDIVETKYALILNPDAFIEKESILTVVNELNNDEKIAIAGPLVLKNYPLDKTELNELKNDINKDLSTIKDIHRKRTNNLIDVGFLTGACLFLRISVFKKIGFFDENIFMYYEDDDLCRRVNINGLKNVLIENAYAFHVGGSSSKKTLNSIFKKAWHINGWSKLYWKKLRKGKFAAKKSSVRLVFKYLKLSLFSLVKFDLNKFLSQSGALCGSFAFLIGLSAFNSKGEGRGSF